MHPLILLALSAMVAAAPQSLPANATNVTDDLTLIGSSSEQAGRNYTKDEVHANVLQHYPRERIINSSSINQYIADNFGANHTIYVSDLEEWIPMSSVRKGNNSTQSLDKRTGGPNPCQYYYTTTWTEQTGQWPGAWYPVSSCSYNGLDSEEASTEIDWSSSYSIQESAGLSWDIIESVLSASLSVSVTETVRISPLPVIIPLKLILINVVDVRGILPMRYSRQ